MSVTIGTPSPVPGCTCGPEGTPTWGSYHSADCPAVTGRQQCTWHQADRRCLLSAGHSCNHEFFSARLMAEGTEELRRAVAAVGEDAAAIFANATDVRVGVGSGSPPPGAREWVSARHPITLPFRVFTYPESMPMADIKGASEALGDAGRDGGWALVPKGIQELGISATAASFEASFIAAEEATDAYKAHQRACGPCRDRIDCDELERLDAAAVTAGSAHAAAAEASRAAWAARRRP